MDGFAAVSAVGVVSEFSHCELLSLHFQGNKRKKGPVQVLSACAGPLYRIMTEKGSPLLLYSRATPESRAACATAAATAGRTASSKA